MTGIALLVNWWKCTAVFWTFRIYILNRIHINK